MPDEIMIYLVFWFIVGTLIGALIGQSKGRVGAGAFFGFILGAIGWLIIALGPNLKPKCPHCGGVIVVGATKCKNCGSDLNFHNSSSSSFSSRRGIK